MVKTVIYIGEDFKNIDFNNVYDNYLKVNGFIHSVGCSFDDKSKYSDEFAINLGLKVCESVNAKLAVVYKEEFEDKIVTYFYSKK